MTPKKIETLAEKRSLPLITIPDDVLASFGRARNVWEDLYKWLVAEHGAVENPEPPFPSLQDRVLVGDKLMAKLIEIERNRLSRRRDGKLRDAIRQSNRGSGPMQKIRGQQLVGDGCIVLPPETACEVLS